MDEIVQLQQTAECGAADAQLSPSSFCLSDECDEAVGYLTGRFLLFCNSSFPLPKDVVTSRSPEQMIGLCSQSLFTHHLADRCCGAIGLSGASEGR